MNSKSTYAILIAVVLAALAVWWAQSGGGAAGANARTSHEPKPLFDHAPKNIAAVEIALQARPAMAFVKVDEKWRLTEPIKAPASAATVNGSTSRITDARYLQAFKAGEADRPSDELTGLDKPTRVKLTDKDGKSTIIKIGAVVPASNSAYLQKDTDDTIYVVEDGIKRDLERTLNDYRDRQICQFDANEAVRIEIGAEHPYVLSKAGEQWTLESPVRARAARSGVDALIRAISGISVTSFIDDNPKNLAVYGLSTPSSLVTVHCEKKVPKPAPATQSTLPAAPQFDIKPYTVAIAFGAKTGDKRFARLEGTDTPWVFQVYEATMKAAAPEMMSLRDKVLMQLEINRAQKVILSGGGGDVGLTKKDGQWSLAGAAFAAVTNKVAEFSAVDDLLRAARDLRATAFESGEESLRDYGFKSPRSRIEITMEGALEPLRLLVGGTTPSGTGTYVKQVNENTVAVIKAEDAKALIVEPLSLVNRDMLRFDRAHANRLQVTRDKLAHTVEMINGQWRFTAPISGEADVPATNNALTDLATLRARRVVGTKADLGRFGLDHPQLSARITIQPPAPPPPTPSTQTTQPQATQPAPPPPPPQTFALIASRKGDNAYVQIEGSPTIGEVDMRVYDNLGAEMLDRRVTRLQSSEVTGLTITPKSGKPLHFEKIGDKWQLAGENTFICDVAKLSAVISAFTGCKTDRYVAYNTNDLKPFGLAAPELAVAIVAGTQPAQEMRVSGGGPPGDASGRRYATIVGSGRVFLIGKDDLAKFPTDIKSYQAAQ